METVPVKCAPMDCGEPGSKPACQLCPNSPTYWRRAETQEAPREAEPSR